MNSVLQILLNCTEFANFMLEGEHSVINYNSQYKGALTRELIDLLSKKWKEKEEVIAPKGFKETFGEIFELFKGTKEQDACEFLSLLFEVIDEDTNIGLKKARIREAKLEKEDDFQKYSFGANKKQLSSCLSELFRGQIKEVVKCENNHREVRFSPINYLQLNFTDSNKVKIVLKFFDLGEIISTNSKTSKQLTEEIEVFEYKHKLNISDFGLTLSKLTKIDVIEECSEIMVWANNQEVNHPNQKLSEYLPEGGEIKIFKYLTLKDTNKYFKNRGNEVIRLKVTFLIKKEDKYRRYSVNASESIRVYFSIPLTKDTEYEWHKIEKLICLLINTIYEDMCLDSATLRLLAKREGYSTKYCWKEVENDTDLIIFKIDRFIGVDLIGHDFNDGQRQTKETKSCLTLEKMLALQSEFEPVEGKLRCDWCHDRVNHSISSSISYISDYIVFALARFKIENRLAFK